jgi:hypothetical protein
MSNRGRKKAINGGSHTGAPNIVTKVVCVGY